ncbi:uncharacterized protein [Panulirus ornatus]
MRPTTVARTLCLLLVVTTTLTEARPQFLDAVGDFVENVGEGVGDFFEGVGDFFSGLFGSGRSRSTPVPSIPPGGTPTGPSFGLGPQLPGPIPEKPGLIPQQPGLNPQRPLTFEEALNTNNLRLLVDD